MRWSVVCLLVSLLVSPALGQERRPSHCIALADATPGIAYVQQASWRDEVQVDQVRIRYIAHASFLLQSAGGLNVVTDYTGFLGTAQMIPDVVTMNHAHETHFTDYPDPAIPHVLQGWGALGGGIDHYLDLGEMLIRNVSTDIRSPYVGSESEGNSIFVFEVGGLCIGHLGHLHHIPTPSQYAALGRLDVVMAPVDGGLTLPLPEMITVLRRLRSLVVVPMHWFSDASLQQFLAGIGPGFDVRDTGESSFVMSLWELPARPTVWVLRPEYLSADE